MAPAIEIWFLNVLPSIPKTYFFCGRRSWLISYGASLEEVLDPSLAVIFERYCPVVEEGSLSLAHL